jgi:hypothetical protein
MHSVMPMTSCSIASAIRPMSRLHAEVFDLEEFLDAVFEPSRPIPLSFMAPKGAISVKMMPSLMPTMPYSRPSATRQMRPMSRL